MKKVISANEIARIKNIPIETILELSEDGLLTPIKFGEKMFVYDEEEVENLFRKKTITANEYSFIDDSFKSLMFQKIMDLKISRNERDILIVIFRKTISNNKWSGRISMETLASDVGISDTTLRLTLNMIESKKLIEINRSAGGKSENDKKYNEFKLSVSSICVDKG